MRLRIRHETTFAYDEQISEAYTEVRLRPLDGGGQECLGFRLVTEPRSPVLSYVDRFGNDVRHFDVLESHDRLVVVATSDVITAPAYRGEGAALSELDRYDYLAGTGYAPLGGAVSRLASGVARGDPHELMHAVHAALSYETGATHVRTTGDEALELGLGVCQDFAHVLVAACRTRGIPARYVSGYLFDPRHTGGHAASHAWIDVFVESRGWVSLDPTHDREQDDHYVRIGIGRDYADVPPTRGVYLGNAREELSVGVSVTAL